MSRITLLNLETLCWIARLGSFTAAADRLSTTQPAISKRVKDLEDSIGVKLFRRQGRRMELTIEGRALVQRAEPLLTELDDLVVFGDHLAAATGTIRIGIGEIVAVTWCSRLMARLRQQMPGVNYELQVGLTVDMRHKLEVGLLDLAILAGPIESRQLSCTNVGSVDMHWLSGFMLMPPPGSKVAGRAMLEQHPVWCVARPSHMHGMAVETMHRVGLPHKSMNTSDSVQSIVELVANGAGIALLPHPLVAQLIAERRVLVLDDLAPDRMDFLIARRRDQDQPILKQIVATAAETSGFLSPS
jgi:DNA-binding transcriptional LysR family regulator